MKSRIITATILIAAVVWAIFFAPPIVFEVFIVLFLGVAGWEWAGLVPAIKNSSVKKALFLVLVELLWIGFSLWPVGFQGLLYFNAVLLVLLVPALFTYPQSAQSWYSSTAVIILGISFLVTSSVSLEYLKERPQGELWLMTVLLLTWLMDTGAYFVGRFLGRHKLIPLVSPNKTWEGLWGGFVLSELIVIGFGWKFAAATMGWGWWILAGTLAILGAVIGDLFISMLKRCAQVKDTGSLLPGHGGVLDRVDSLIVSATIIVLFLVGVGG